MNNAKNSEVDLILRSLAKAERGLPPDEKVSHGVSATEHLDADELNMFAEGVMPERARARHIAHLADCATCRKMVASLTQAAGIPSYAPVKEKSGASDVWARLTAIFSPSILRYAVPVLLLAGIIGIALIALRRPDSSDFVARQEPTNVSSNQENATIPDAGAAATDSGEGQAPATRTSTDQAARSGEVRTNQKTPTATNIESAPLATPKDSAGEAPAEKSQPTFAPEPASAPPAAPRPGKATVDEIATPKKEALAKIEEQQRREDNYKFQTREADANRAADSKTARNSPTTGGVQGLMTERRGYGVRNKRDSDAEAETRTISGRKFRRQGSAWIDVAYNSSISTTNIKRDSEQFRALVADEPGIGNIAQQLSGEVVVVWKGRAYRLR
jgi:hypothetical protein